MQFKYCERLFLVLCEMLIVIIIFLKGVADLLVKKLVYTGLKRIPSFFYYYGVKVSYGFRVFSLLYV